MLLACFVSFAALQTMELLENPEMLAGQLEALLEDPAVMAEVKPRNHFFYMMNAESKEFASFSVLAYASLMSELLARAEVSRYFSYPLFLSLGNQIC